MPSSKKFVYFPSIKKDCWLLWSKRGKSVYLRDYSQGKCKVVKKLSLGKANLLLNNARQMHQDEMGCFNKIRVDREVFWQELQNSYNCISGFTEKGKKQKLQEKFKTLCLPHLVDGNVDELLSLIHISEPTRPY